MEDLTLSVVCAKQSMSGTHVDSTALLQARSSKKFDDMFNTMFKEKLDLIGENELLKHNHAALEQKKENLQRELDISNQ